MSFAICNDSSNYMVIVGSRVVFKTNAVMDLYRYVTKLRNKGQEFEIR